MELLSQGLPIAGVGEMLQKNFGDRTLPKAISRYLLCSPNMDFVFRCWPSDGGLYDQRLRDVIDFAIIETRLRHVQSRN